MNTRINFEDDVFYLNSSLRLLRSALNLDLDSDFFLKKTLDDVLFVHDILLKLYADIKRSQHLIQRAEFLRQLLIAKQDFIVFLTELKRGRGTFIGELKNFSSQFQQCEEIHSADIREIQVSIEHESGEASDESDIISVDEYQYLFKQDSDSDIV